MMLANFNRFFSMRQFALFVVSFLFLTVGLSFACLPVIGVTASSVKGGNTAAMSYDASTSTRWESIHEVDPQWITFDLGSPKSINRIKLDWETASASYYHIKGSLDNDHWTPIIERGPLTSSQHRIDDMTGLSGIYRYIQVFMTYRTTQYGYSIWEAEIYGEDANPPPAAPTDLSLTVTGSSSIRLNWTDNASNEMGFYVYKSLTSTKPGVITQTLAANTVSYTATGLEPEALYYFWVEAYNANGSSAHITGSKTLNSGLLISDDFARADGAVLGGGWLEVEVTDLHMVSIAGGKMQFTNGDQDVMRPLVKKPFTAATSGYVEWNFLMEWSRQSESTYEVRMQLGADMTDDDPNGGVGVDLRWGDTKTGFTSEGGFGYVTAGGQGIQVTPGPISSIHPVKVVANITSHTYDLYLDGNLVKNSAPFRNSVDISQARMWTQNVGNGILGRTFDDISLQTATYHTVTSAKIPADGSMGIINPLGSLYLPEGATQQYNLYYDPMNYKVAALKVNNVPVSIPVNYTYSHTVGNLDQTIEVTYAPLETFTVTTTYSGAGSIPPVVENVLEGRDIQVNFAAVPGYSITAVMVDGAALPAVVGSYSFESVMANHAIELVMAREYLPLAGGKMVGDIKMDGNNILSIGELAGSKLTINTANDSLAAIVLKGSQIITTGTNDVYALIVSGKTKVQPQTGSGIVFFNGHENEAGEVFISGIHATDNTKSANIHLTGRGDGDTKVFVQGDLDVSGTLNANTFHVGTDLTIGEWPNDLANVDIKGVFKTEANSHSSMNFYSNEEFDGRAVFEIKDWQGDPWMRFSKNIVYQGVVTERHLDIEYSGSSLVFSPGSQNGMNAIHYKFPGGAPGTSDGISFVKNYEMGSPGIEIWDKDPSGQPENKPYLLFAKGISVEDPNKAEKGISIVYDGEKLDISGDIKVNSVITTSWKIAPPADYVFEPNYNLRDLNEVEQFVKANKHLPEIQSGKEMMEKGLDLAAMNMQLLKKVEELTLYAIEQNKKIKKYEEKVSAQESRINRIESILSKD